MTAHAPPATPEGSKARRVYLSLRDKISNGLFQAGTHLPTEARLAQSYQVSRITVRRALEALAADGLIAKRAGSGSMVLERDEPGAEIKADIASLMPQLVHMDETTTVRLLSFSYGRATARVADALGLPRSATVQTAVRVRSSDGEPFSHLTTHVPEAVARHYGENDLAKQPLFRLLERGGVQIAEAEQSVTATLAAPDVADVLNVEVGSALLSLRRVVRDTSGRGVEYLSALYRPDRFRLEMSLARVGAGDARHWEPVIGDNAR